MTQLRIGKTWSSCSLDTSFERRRSSIWITCALRCTSQASNKSRARTTKCTPSSTSCSARLSPQCARSTEPTNMAVSRDFKSWPSHLIWMFWRRPWLRRGTASSTNFSSTINFAAKFKWLWLSRPRPYQQKRYPATWCFSNRFAQSKKIWLKRFNSSMWLRAVSKTSKTSSIVSKIRLAPN